MKYFRAEAKHSTHFIYKVLYLWITWQCILALIHYLRCVVFLFFFLISNYLSRMRTKKMKKIESNLHHTVCCSVFLFSSSNVLLMLWVRISVSFFSKIYLPHSNIFEYFYYHHHSIADGYNKQTTINTRLVCVHRTHHRLYFISFFGSILNNFTVCFES